jgi:putative ATPase
MDLFEAARKDDPEGVPLAARMRPRTLAEVVGQRHLVAEDGLLRRCVRSGAIPSIVFWGPPGTGKTTLAEALSAEIEGRFVRMSAVLAGVKDIREAIKDAERARYEHGKRTLLFVDEIHRFNKSQQDALLPHVEKGTVTLIGATTENPSFEVNAALLSRCRVLVTKPLEDEDQHALLERALSTKTRGLGELGLTMDEDARAALVHVASGDARRLLTTLEVAADLTRADGDKAISLDHIEQAAAQRVVMFDKKGDAHYGVISAFIKSLRGSDPDAALHYLARMLEAGEDPRFILRRLVVFASEDVGNADPRGLQVAVAALHAFELLGLPEGRIPLAQATTFLATAPKSNAAYKAIDAAIADVREQPNAPVPLHLQNAATDLLKKQGHGDGYKYPHDFEGNWVADEYLPEALRGRTYYHPSNNGLEKTIAERLAHWRERREAELLEKRHAS